MDFQNIVGIDIGNKTLKLVYSARGVAKVAGEDLPDNLVDNGVITSMDAMADFIKETAKKYSIPKRKAAIILPPSLVFVKVTTMPIMSSKQLRANLPFEMRDYLTDDKSTYYFDYSVRRIIYDNDGNPSGVELFVCAAKKSIVEEYRDMLHRAGFRLHRVYPAEYVGELVVNEARTKTENFPDYCSIVDIGHSATKIYIFKNGEYAVKRSVNIGLSAIENIIANTLSVDEYTAHEYLKTNFDNCQSYDFVRDIYSNIGAEILKAINFFNYNNADSTLNDVYICGGGAKIETLVNDIKDILDTQIHPIKELISEVDNIDEFCSYTFAYGSTLPNVSAGIADFPKNTKKRLSKKATIDLNFNEQSKNNLIAMGIIFPALFVFVLAFSEFAVLGRIQIADNLRKEYNVLHSQRVKLEEEIKDYDAIELEYHKKNIDWFESDATYNVVNRQKVLDILENELLTRATVGSVNISGNTLTVSMSGINLVGLSELTKVLREYDIVDTVSTNSVSTNGTEEVEYALNLTLSITFHSVFETKGD